MTAMLELPAAVTLTAEEYEALPPNSRVELVDGVLDVMPPPTGRHQEVVELLKRRLEEVCPAELRVVREQELRLGNLHRRNLDLMVIRAGAYDPDGYSYRPADVVAAVEVVSPGTQTRDRQHKLVEYAGAEVPHYWRVEISPGVVLHTYQLGETGAYLETGLFRPGDTAAVPGLPWARVEVSGFDPA